MNHHLGTVLACSLLVVLTACGTDDGAPDVGRESSEPSGPATTSSPPPTSSPSSSPTSSPSTPPSTPSEAMQKVRVVGVVVQDGDCVAVEDDNGTTWTIAGEPAAGLRVGDRVQVTGAPNIAATGCAGPLIEASRVTTTG